ncbi:hypothetical protein ACFQ1E_18760 [Sphingomonas canadensis]|uniref:Uncharacterized protein n=1 Tax=Sphingomonas canadensis TaxID=1219257 RepID=A0ABW3HA65_9SPHN|nr:hypothetical protein [Sphingomonas canadensis]MCW3838075.1 hypothetical protein [Sphingomonas canadensis]
MAGLAAAAVPASSADTPGAPAPEVVKRYCTLMDETGSVYQGKCTETWMDNGVVIDMPGHKFTVVEYDPMRHELPWMMLMVNGVPAVAYQRHKSWTSYTNFDLKWVLDVCQTAGSTGDCE